MILTEVDFPPNSGAQGQANIKQIGPHHTSQTATATELQTNLRED